MNGILLDGYNLTNQKKAVENFDCIQSVDSIKLLDNINRHAETIKKVQRIYLQINMANEIQKAGFDPAELELVLDQIKRYENVNVEGIMCIGAHTEDRSIIDACFAEMKNLKDKLSLKLPSIQLLSMGMSSDYQLAIKHGATHIRLGSILFR